MLNNKLYVSLKLSTLNTVIGYSNFRFVKLICVTEKIYKLTWEKAYKYWTISQQNHITDRSIENPEVFLDANIESNDNDGYACRKYGIKEMSSGKSTR